MLIGGTFEITSNNTLILSIFKLTFFESYRLEFFQQCLDRDDFFQFWVISKNDLLFVRSIFYAPHWWKIWQCDCAFCWVLQSHDCSCTSFFCCLERYCSTCWTPSEQSNNVILSTNWKFWNHESLIFWFQIALSSILRQSLQKRKCYRLRQSQRTFISASISVLSLIYFWVVDLRSWSCIGDSFRFNITCHPLYKICHKQLFALS